MATPSWQAHCRKNKKKDEHCPERKPLFMACSQIENVWKRERNARSKQITQYKT